MSKTNSSSALVRLQEKPIALTSKNLTEVAKILKAKPQDLVIRIQLAIEKPYHQHLYLIFIKDSGLKIKAVNFNKIIEAYNGHLPSSGQSRPKKVGKGLEIDNSQALTRYLSEVESLLREMYSCKKKILRHNVGIKLACMLVNEYGEDALLQLEELQIYIASRFDGMKLQDKIKAMYRILYSMHNRPQVLSVWELDKYEDDLAGALESSEDFG